MQPDQQTPREIAHTLAEYARASVESALRYQHAIGPPGPRAVSMQIGNVTRSGDAMLVSVSLTVASQTPEVLIYESPGLIGYPP